MEIKVADGIKVANQPTLKQREYLGFSGWAQYNHKGLAKCKREAELQGYYVRRTTLPTVAGFEDGGRATSQRMQAASRS